MKDLFDYENFDEESFYLLLDSGYDINQPDAVGLTPLHLACHHNQFAYFCALLQNNADVNARDFDGWTPLHLATSAEMARMLLEAGADPNALGLMDDSPLLLCNDPEIAQVLLENNADVNARDRDGWTALFNSRSPDLTRVLLNSGADPTIKDNDGNLAYEICVPQCRSMLKDAYDDAINRQQKERILDAINEEQPIEHKSVYKRRRM